jgi:hypothetical protein
LAIDFSEFEDKVSSFVNVFFTGLTLAAAGLRKIFRFFFATKVFPDLSARLRLCEASFLRDHARVKLQNDKCFTF